MFCFRRLHPYLAIEELLTHSKSKRQDWSKSLFSKTPRNVLTLYIQLIIIMD